MVSGLSWWGWSGVSVERLCRRCKEREATHHLWWRDRFGDRVEVGWFCLGCKDAAADEFGDRMEDERDGG